MILTQMSFCRFLCYVCLGEDFGNWFECEMWNMIIHLLESVYFLDSIIGMVVLIPFLWVGSILVKESRGWLFGWPLDDEMVEYMETFADGCGLE